MAKISVSDQRIGRESFVFDDILLIMYCNVIAVDDEVKMMPKSFKHIVGLGFLYIFMAVSR